MLSRYPDKPLMSAPAILPTLREGQWLVESKADGWRCVTERTPAGWRFTTRHSKPCPVSPDLAKSLTAQLAHLPVGTMLDGEWMARRAGLGQERMILFDVMQLGSQWKGGMGALERWELLCSLVPQELLVAHTLSDYVGFFERTKQDPLTEGIVAKRIDSKYVGSVRSCTDNCLWLKVRWRSGADGNRLVA